MLLVHTHVQPTHPMALPCTAWDGRLLSWAISLPSWQTLSPGGQHMPTAAQLLFGHVCPSVYHYVLHFACLKHEQLVM